MNAIQSTNELVFDLLGRHTDSLGIKSADDINENILFSELNADSLDMAELMMACEEVFAIEIPDDTISTWLSVGDVYNYVESRM